MHGSQAWVCANIDYCCSKSTFCLRQGCTKKSHGWSITATQLEEIPCELMTPVDDGMRNQLAYGLIWRYKVKCDDMHVIRGFNAGPYFRYGLQIIWSYIRHSPKACTWCSFCHIQSLSSARCRFFFFSPYCLHFTVPHVAVNSMSCTFSIFAFSSVGSRNQLQQHPCHLSPRPTCPLMHFLQELDCIWLIPIKFPILKWSRQRDKLLTR